MKNTTRGSVDTSKETNGLTSNSFGIDSFYLKDQPTGISIGSKYIGTFISKEGDSYRYGEIKGSREEVVEAVSWMVGIDSLVGELDKRYEVIGAKIVMREDGSGNEYPVLVTQKISEENPEEHLLISIEGWLKKTDQDPVKKNIEYMVASLNKSFGRLSPEEHNYNDEDEEGGPEEY